MTAAIDESVLARAREVRLLTCDVDGVLTDGTIYVGADGQEYKAFCVLDGVGLKRMHEIGVAVAWLSGSKAPAIAHRARALGIARVVLGMEDKLGPWEVLRDELALSDAQCAHIGDDLPDVPVLARCGLAITVPHAVDHVKSIAHFVTARGGGHGAVREVCDLLLRAHGAPERYAISGA